MMQIENCKLVTGSVHSSTPRRTLRLSNHTNRAPFFASMQVFRQDGSPKDFQLSKHKSFGRNGKSLSVFPKDTTMQDQFKYRTGKHNSLVRASFIIKIINIVLISQLSWRRCANLNSNARLQQIARVLEHEKHSKLKTYKTQQHVSSVLIFALTLSSTS